MQPPKVVPFIGLVVLLSLINCGKNATSPSSANDDMLYKGAVVITTEDLPSCDSVKEGLLYYVLDDANFQYCDGEEYVVLDIGGESGVGTFNWLGNRNSPPDDPSLHDAYHNTTKGIAFIWDGSEWDTLVTSGRDGADGADGKSVVWQGALSSAPEDPDTNWVYFNSDDKVTYIFNGTAWDTLAVSGADGNSGTDGTAGADGVDGKSVLWQGTSESDPENPQTNWAYFNTAEKVTYIFNGTAWDTLSVSGSNGTDGTNGKSVIWKGILSSAPSNPDTNWAYYNSVKKVTYLFNGTAWDTLAVSGADGTDGINGTAGVPGTAGINGRSIIWQGVASSAPMGPDTNWAYYNSADKVSYIFNGTAWDTLSVSGKDGTSGTDGTNGLNTLLRVTAEPAGSNCTAGGERVETGLDNNRNGILDNNEVRDTSYICWKEKIWYGDYTVTDIASRNLISGYTGITGNLTITSVSGLENLNFLNWLTSVGGYINIGNNTALTNVGGLNALASVGGTLYIESNAVLTNVDGLSALASVGGNISIQSNAALTNVDGLSALTSVGGYLNIQSNAALTNLDGLSALTSVGGTLYISSNAALTNVDGLSALASVEGDLDISNNAALTNVDGLSVITSVGGYLALYSNAALTNVDGLSALTSVGGILYFENNTILTNLDGLSALASVGEYLYINSNAALTNVDGLSALTSVGGDFYLIQNPSLLSMTGLNNLTTVGGNFQVTNNTVLPACQAHNIVDNLTVYTGTTTITGNDDVATCP